MSALIEASNCTPAAGVQRSIETAADNTKPAAPFGLRATWLHFANELEIRRLAKLHVRIERKKAALTELVSQRQSIMRRCIKRMRRAQGKN